MFHSDKWKALSKKLPLHIKVPVLFSGLFGTLLNCLVSAFAGTIVFNYILDRGFTLFFAKFFSLAFTLFTVQILNVGMTITGHYIMDRLHKNDDGRV